MAAAVPLILARATRRSFLSLFSSSEQLSDEIAMAEKETSDILAKDKKLRDEGTGNLEQTVKTMSDMTAATKIQAIGARPLLARRALARAATKIQAIGARPLLARRAFQRLRRARAATKIQAIGARPLLARRALKAAKAAADKAAADKAAVDKAAADKAAAAKAAADKAAAAKAQQEAEDAQLAAAFAASLAVSPCPTTSPALSHHLPRQRDPSLWTILQLA